MVEWLKNKKMYFLGGIAIVHGVFLFITGEATLAQVLSDPEFSRPVDEMFGGGLIMAVKAALQKVGINI